MRILPIGLRHALIAVALILAPTLARADCSADFRKVQLGADKSGGIGAPDERNAASQIVRLRGYLCGAGTDPNSPQVRVEFHRLSDGAAGVLVQKRSLAGLAQVFGSPRIIENDVFKTYADLLRRFGAAPEPQEPSLSVEASGSESAQLKEKESDIKGIRTLNSIPRKDGVHVVFYPAANEIEALRARSLPAPLKYFYSAPDSRMVFWRSVGPGDVTNYAANAKAFNVLLRRLRGKKHTAKFDVPATIPVTLKLLQYIAGDRWPNDFVIMSASVDTEQMIPRSEVGDEDGCGDERVSNLTFEIVYPSIILDTVLIENISNVPVKLDSLHGSQSSVSTLRALGSDSTELTSASFDMSRTLAPGERVLVPLKISLEPQIWEGGPATDNAADWSKLLRTSAQFQRKLGTSGLRASPASHAVPLLKTYLFGPELSIIGLTIDGRRIELEQRSANFSDLVITIEGLSCPYLLSWDAANRTWVEHGKVLDKAPSRAREYSELKSFTGFKSRFRIEEREPEIAFIRDVNLVAILNDHVALTLKPKRVVTAAEREGEYLSLYWGEAADFEFELPPDIAEDQVATSRFVVTGYYRRYSALLAQDGGPGIGPLSAHPMASSNR